MYLPIKIFSRPLGRGQIYVSLIGGTEDGRLTLFLIAGLLCSWGTPEKNDLRAFFCNFHFVSKLVAAIYKRRGIFAGGTGTDNNPL